MKVKKRKGGMVYLNKIKITKIKQQKAKNLLKNLVSYGAEPGGSWNKKGLTRVLSSLCEEQRLMIGEQWSRNEEK